jgi:hypothetical protein
MAFGGSEHASALICAAVKPGYEPEQCINFNAKHPTRIFGPSFVRKNPGYALEAGKTIRFQDRKRKSYVDETGSCVSKTHLHL